MTDAAPRLLLWTDTPAAYEAAIAEAGLAPRVRVTALSRKETPGPELLAELSASQEPLEREAFQPLTLN